MSIKYKNLVINLFVSQQTLSVTRIPACLEAPARRRQIRMSVYVLETGSEDTVNTHWVSYYSGLTCI